MHVGEVHVIRLRGIISFDCRITARLVYSCTHSKSKCRDVQWM